MVVRTLLDVEKVNIFGYPIDVFWVIALGLAFTTGVYTIMGGMRVIMYTAVLQVPVLLFGSFCILYVGLNTLGNGSLIDGWHKTLDTVGANVHLIRSPKIPSGPGRPFCSGRRLLVSGIGAQINTLFNASWLVRTNRNPAAVPFSLAT